MSVTCFVKKKATHYCALCKRRPLTKLTRRGALYDRPVLGAAAVTDRLALAVVGVKAVLQRRVALASVFCREPLTMPTAVSSVALDLPLSNGFPRCVGAGTGTGAGTAYVFGGCRPMDGWQYAQNNTRTPQQCLPVRLWPEPRLPSTVPSIV